jgi:hypothetical protein
MVAKNLQEEEQKLGNSQDAIYCEGNKKTATSQFEISV